jgi:uncharacterized protein YdhG (YjbR/CyaY superfamily)
MRRARVGARAKIVDRRAALAENPLVSAQEIDDYLATLDQPERDALEGLRATILDILPDAEQCLAYRVPAFKDGGHVVAGFAAAKNHLSYFPHSGWVLSQVRDDVASYSTSKGTLRFGVDRPLPNSLVRKLIDLRQAEIDRGR